MLTVILCVVLAALLVLLLVLTGRGIAFRPAKEEKIPRVPEEFDREKAGEDLKALKSSRAPETMAKLFPALWKGAEALSAGESGLVLHVPGQKSDASGVLVLPTDREVPGSLCAALEAADSLLAGGTVPEQDLYLCLSRSPEDTEACAALLEEKNVRPALVLGEGGSLEKAFPGIRHPCALVGIAEKGAARVTLTVHARGGAADASPAQTAMGILSRAVARAEASCYPFRLTAPVCALLDALGRHARLFYRILIVNLPLFRPLLRLNGRRSGGVLRAVTRSTVGFTSFTARSEGSGVPADASAAAELRILCGQTSESALKQLKRMLRDSRVEVRAEAVTEPSPVSVTGDGNWQRVNRAVAGTWTDAVIAPSLLLSPSGIAPYVRLCDHVYRFTPPVTENTEDLFRAVAFYRRLIRRA